MVRDERSAVGRMIDRLVKGPAAAQPEAQLARGSSPDITGGDPKALVRQHVGSGHAARGKLQAAIGRADHGAAVEAMIALSTDVRSARQHLATMPRDPMLSSEVAAFDGLAQAAMQQLPQMAKAVADRGVPFETWGPESDEWKKVVGAAAEAKKKKEEKVAAPSALPTLALGKGKAPAKPGKPGDKADAKADGKQPVDPKAAAKPKTAADAKAEEAATSARPKQGPVANADGAPTAAVRPDKAGHALAALHDAKANEIGKTRADHAASPPSQMSTGDAAAPKAKPGAKPEGAAADGKADAKKDAKDPKALKAKDGKDPEAAKDAKQANANHDKASAASAATHGVAASDKKVTKAETKSMGSALASLDTRVHASTNAGAAPSLAVKQQVAGGAQQDRAQFEARANEQHAKAVSESSVPLGEDHIATTLVPEELAAAPAKAAPVAPSALLPTLKGAAPSEEVGIIAQQNAGAEIDAALAKADADTKTEKAAHAQAEAKVRAEHDQSMAKLKASSDAEQAAAKAAAKAEVGAQRDQWKAEIDKKTTEARASADKKVAEGMQQITAEETKANAEAQRHIAEGNAKAEDERQKGEREASAAQAKGQEESKGFFGWVARKARAAFNAVKAAVSAAIDLARRAVKAAIDAAKSLAMAAIDLAKKAITAIAKGIGQALLALSDVLLAAFPELKAKFQAAVKATVAKAVAVVDKLADGLKKGVQTLLDLAAAGLDAALALYEKAIHFIIDAAGAVVDAAIKAAQAVADALGTWVVLVKDVASGPLSWIGKLGAAATDGIKNHLWTALKSAVIEWFTSKVFEMLGIGGVILQMLFDGGFTVQSLTQMALEALMTAIPIALVAVLLEQLIAMIVPAAGAVMAVIRGLQAAWGTISRIIAAISSFVAFLLAVKDGQAGPQFATMIAAGAVVLLDFVANYLIAKLAKGARAVGGRMKGMAGKFGKKGAKAPKASRSAKSGKAPTKKAKNPNKQKSKDGKKDGKKKKKDDGDMKAAQTAARTAARHAWNEARATSGKRVVAASEIRSIVARANRSGKTKVAVEMQEHGTSWKVHARATVGKHTKTATTGNGTSLRAKSVGTFYTSKNLTPLHKQIVRETSQALKKHDGAKHKTLAAAYQAKLALARRLQQKGQAKIDSRVHGLKFDVEMAPWREGQKSKDVQTTLLITPNYEELKLVVDLECEAYAALIADLKAHVVPKTFHNNDVLLAEVDRYAKKHKIEWSVQEVKGRVMFMAVTFRSPDVAETLQARIDTTAHNKLCPSCHQPTGNGKGDRTQPHNVIPQQMWKHAVEGALRSVGKFNEASQTHKHLIGWFQGRSAAGTGEPYAKDKGEYQKQCKHCEAPVASHSKDPDPIYKKNGGTNLSLIQRGRVRGAKRGDPDENDAIVGKQFGGVDSTHDHRVEVTDAHIIKVAGQFVGECERLQRLVDRDRARLPPGTVITYDRATDPTADVLHSPLREQFLLHVRTNIRSLAHGPVLP